MPLRSFLRCLPNDLLACEEYPNMLQAALSMDSGELGIRRAAKGVGHEEATG